MADVLERGVSFMSMLTGASATALEKVSVTTIQQGRVNICCSEDLSGVYFHRFEAAGTAAHNPPNVIRPFDYTVVGQGNWVIQTSPFLSQQISRAIVDAEDDIFGGDSTVAGNVVTISPYACLDSTGTVQLHSETGGDVTLPGTVSQGFHIFTVRLLAGTIELRAYPVVTDPASDAGINAYRRLDWAQNDAAGVTRPYKRTGKNIEWLVAASMPVLAASLTGAYVSKDFNAVLPAGFYLDASINSSTNETVFYSFDGTTDAGAFVFSSLTVGPSSIYLKYNTTTTVMRITKMTLRR